MNAMVENDPQETSRFRAAIHMTVVHFNPANWVCQLFALGFPFGTAERTPTQFFQAELGRNITTDASNLYLDHKDLKECLVAKEET